MHDNALHAKVQNSTKDPPLLARVLLQARGSGKQRNLQEVGARGVCTFSAGPVAVLESIKVVAMSSHKAFDFTPGAVPRPRFWYLLAPRFRFAFPHLVSTLVALIYLGRLALILSLALCLCLLLHPLLVPLGQRAALVRMAALLRPVRQLARAITVPHALARSAHDREPPHSLAASRAVQDSIL